jgi:hypothetical protein
MAKQPMKAREKTSMANKKRLSEHYHRQNLELMYNTRVQFFSAFVTAAFMVLVAFLTLYFETGNIIIWLGGLLAAIMVIGMGYFSFVHKKMKTIAKKLRFEETEEYLKSGENDTKRFGSQTAIGTLLCFAVVVIAGAHIWYGYIGPWRDGGHTVAFAFALPITAGLLLVLGLGLWLGWIMAKDTK